MAAISTKVLGGAEVGPLPLMLAAKGLLGLPASTCDAQQRSGTATHTWTLSPEKRQLVVPPTPPLHHHMSQLPRGALLSALSDFREAPKTPLLWAI